MGGFQQLFKVKAQKEIDINKEEEKGLIKRQLVAMFKTVIEELEKVDKEVNLII